MTEGPPHHGHPIGGEAAANSHDADQERGRPALRGLSLLLSYSLQAISTFIEGPSHAVGPLWEIFTTRVHRCASTSLLILNLANSEDRLW